MRFLFPIIHEGDGTTFNRGNPELSIWAGRWGEYYTKNKYPKTWKVRVLWRRLQTMRGGKV